MIFKPMKMEDVLKVLEGQENIIQPAVDSHLAFFQHLSCPSCGGDVMPIVNTSKPFSPGSILPNYLGKCRNCDVQFDPYTKIQITLPTVR